MYEVIVLALIVGGGVSNVRLVLTSLVYYSCPLVHTSQFLIPTFCLTLPNSVRDEKFGIRFVRCRMVYVLKQTMIRVCGEL